MPRIRKKTSNRGSTNERKKILHKVRESRRKTAKAAKKNPQWKSKHKKDPGIPNNFPYKDQILAEVAEQRRIAAEEKERKKAEKKGAKSKEIETKDDGSGSEVEVEVEDTEDIFSSKSLNVGIEGIASLSAKRLIHAKTRTREAPALVVEEEEEEVPVLINRDLPNLKAVLDDSDVVIQVLDARDPLSFRSSYLDNLSTSKPGSRTLLILNKIDTCPRESITSWATYLRTQHPTILFRSATAFLPTGPEPTVKIKGKSKSKPPADDGLGVDSVLACLGKWAKEKKGKKALSVAVVGLANAGKSSFVNSLLRKRALPVYELASSSRGPTTTDLPQEVTIDCSNGKTIRVIDTPGLSWETDELTDGLDDIRARDILMRNKGRIDRLKDPTLPIAHIVSRANTEDLMLLYSLPAFTKGDSNSFLSGVARSHQLIKKRGELDLVGAARIVLRDWSTGKFPRYTVPPPTTETTASHPTSTKVAELYAADDAMLSTLQARKEMRKSGGLIKMITGEIESRKAITEEEWVALRDSDDEDEDGAEEDELMSDDDDPDLINENVEEDIDIDDEEEEDEEDEAPPPMNKKQKRKRAATATPGPPYKKVAFAPDPKDSKQSRKAGSLKDKATAKPVQDKPSPKKVKTSTISSPPAPASVPASTSILKSKVSKLGALKKEKERKVANAGKEKSVGTKPKAAAGGEEVYDFGKFF